MKPHYFCTLATLLAVSSLTAQVRVTVNSTKWEEYPLVKKIGVYQTPLVSREWLARDVPKLGDLEVRSMRYEMACGKDDLYGQPCVTGRVAKPTYNFSAIDYFLTLTAKYAPVLVISHGYTPTILQRRPTEWSGFMDTPTDLDAWGNINGTFAAHWKTKNYTNSYVEIWNEPDLTDGFFTGTLADYLSIYQYAAPPVKQQNPDIKVGGPAGAFNGWHQPLADHAKANSLPLDFLSGHAYGPDYAWQLNAMRTALTSLGNPEAEMLLTEYSPYAAADYQADGPVEKAEAAMTFFRALPGMLECPDLTWVNWAQYIDPGFFVGDKLGLIDRDSGAPKALYNAFRLYGMMPADRRQMTISGGNLGGMASATADCVAAVLWNTEETEKTVALTLTNVPFQSGKLEVYHIDQSTNSWYETRRSSFVPTRAETVNVTARRLQVSDVVRAKGVCFVRLTADDAAPLFPTVKLGRIIRTHQWFPNRTNTAPYALFDPKTWTVRLSSNTDATGRALIGIEAENMPDYLQVNGLRNGTVRRTNTNTAVAIQVDYQDRSGQYVHSVLFHAKPFNAARSSTLPWGTRRQPDEIIEVDDINNVTIPLAEHRPATASGRVIITCDMEAVGTSVKQNFQFAKGTPTGIQEIMKNDEAANGRNTKWSNGKMVNDKCFDLSGHRLNTSSPPFNRGGRGTVFIVEGKKYMLK